jgi:hypothetical protein
MARTVNVGIYKDKAGKVKSLLEGSQTGYKLMKEGDEQFHSIKVEVPFTSGKDMHQQRMKAVKAVRKEFPFRFSFHGSQVVEKEGVKSHRMDWRCYL